MSHINVTIENNLARLVLSNPPQNRLTQEFFDELSDGISLIAASGARAALLAAEGPDFSYGGDIVPWPTLTPAQLRAAFERRLATVNQWEQLPVLTVAAVRGLCFGGGFELAVRSDIIFAGTSARFARANALPTRSASRCTPPSIVTIPSDCSGCPKRAPSHATWRMARRELILLTRRCCVYGPEAARQRPTRRCWTSLCRCSKPKM